MRHISDQALMQVFWVSMVVAQAAVISIIWNTLSLYCESMTPWWPHEPLPMVLILGAAMNDPVEGHWTDYIVRITWFNAMIWVVILGLFIARTVW